MERCKTRFEKRLDEIEKSDPDIAISRFLDHYAEALTLSETMCLRAILEAETNGLPMGVWYQLASFFRLNIGWLADLNANHGLAKSVPPPEEIVSALQGAVIISTSRTDRRVLDDRVARIKASYSAASSAHEAS